YKLAIEGSQDGIWDWDLKSDTMYFSSRWKSMLGYADDEIENSLKAWRHLVHPADKEFVYAALDNHLRKVTPHYSVEFRLRCKDGGYKWISARNKALFDENDKPYRIAGSHTDISERKFMEIELIKAKEKAEESDRLKSAFLANMSHEIRTPMNGILGFSDLLKKPNISGEEQQQYIDIIKESGVRMLNIINDIVSISKIESGLTELNIQESNINEQVEYLYTFFKPEVEGKGMHFSFKTSLPFNESFVKTDKEKLFAILTNLVKNAIKYSESGAIEVGYTKKGEALEFYVKDTGVGIDDDRKKAIFERFIQADISDKNALQGAGLGLSISKAYVGMLGGKLWVESKKDRGSTFYFTIP
ncbi:MAG: PAS domain-containing sensor histidine kinase, partial [Bacteroidales bacterium]|nr:PAS domain-containing sensor histidine kinase [Bacteroidales bacterium]